MSKSHIPAVLRRLARQRAQRIFECCLLHEDDVVRGFHLDHVISEKHGGPTEDHNLAFCCPFCNRAKGSGIAGRENDAPVRLFNPRIDRWAEHFSLESEHIVSRSNIGGVTVRLLGLNDRYRLALRRELMAAGLFPSDDARRLIT